MADAAIEHPEGVRSGLYKTKDGSYAVWCCCGFLETGWPQYRLAVASWDNHREVCDARP